MGHASLASSMFARNGVVSRTLHFSWSVTMRCYTTSNAGNFIFVLSKSTCSQDQLSILYMFKTTASETALLSHATSDVIPNPCE